MNDNKLKEFIDFIGSSKSKVYYYLYNNIIRDSEYKIDKQYDDWNYVDFEKAVIYETLYNDFYINSGLLVATDTQKTIGEFLGSTAATVGNHIRTLLDGKYIKTVRYLIDDGQYYRLYVNVYVLGYIKDGVEYMLYNNKYLNCVDELIDTNINTGTNIPAFFGGING